MYDSGRRCVCTSDTPPVAHPAAGLLLALIGRRASVGGSVGRADWPRAWRGWIWIDFIRHTLVDSQSIVAVPVTGSLIPTTLFSCRDTNYTDRYSICIVCSRVGADVLLYSVLVYSSTYFGVLRCTLYSCTLGMMYSVLMYSWHDVLSTCTRVHS